MTTSAIISPYSVQDERELQDAVLSCVHDPLKFVLFAYPWGEPGTLLEEESGPDAWQVDILDALGAHVRTSDRSFRLAVASGHGIGKSTLVAWIVHWFMSTKPHPQIKVTAGTGDQLEKHTWREVAKWWKLAYNAHWFSWTATKYYQVEHPETWFAAAIPWSKDEDRSQSFAGQHERYTMVIYDEASTIVDRIWEVSDGAMSTPGAIWLAFGNPEKNQGRFKECFPGGRFAAQWHTRQIDSRTAKKTDKQEIAEQIALYGEDSDFVRVRWLGLFPRASIEQFISEALILAAQQREDIPASQYPRIVGVDVARHGNNATVFLLRQGHRILNKRVYREKTTTEVASLLCTYMDEFAPDGVFIDATGIGWGVVDQVRLRHYPVIPVNSGVPSKIKRLVNGEEREVYVNKRAEMWDAVKSWLTDHGCLPRDDRDLAAQLMAPKYGYDDRLRLQIERKEDMQRRGVVSPDEADALCLTFAEIVRPSPERRGPQQRATMGFNPLQSQAAQRARRVPQPTLRW